MNNPNPSACPKCGAPIPENAPQGLCPKCVLMGAATVPAPPNSSTRNTPPPTVGELAPQFPELEILELIGAGGMGAIYKARQPKLDRIVALKVLAQGLAADPGFIERFEREARVLARLNHPNIVTVFDSGMAGPFVFLMMEFVDGVNLRQAMQAGRFTPTEALTLVQDVCGALKFAHEKGILHRDIKPENILIDSRGTVKIADFGIAKLVGENERGYVTLTQQGLVLGSPHYMAPEQFSSPGDVDQRADIYSLGVVLYELLKGELPMGRFAPPSKKSSVDARIDEIVMRTLERERELRFQTIGEVKTRVEDVTQTMGPVPAGPSDAQAAGSGLAPMRGTARFATAAAVLTGISPLLVSFFASFYFGRSLHSHSVSDASSQGLPVALTLLTLLLAVVTPLFGMGFGVNALREIHDAGGQERGVNRALFGALLWPLFLLIAVLDWVVIEAMGLSSSVGLHMSLLSLMDLWMAGFVVIKARAWALGGRSLNPRWRSLGIGLACVFACMIAVTFTGRAPAGTSYSSVASLRGKLEGNAKALEYHGRLVAALELKDKGDRNSALAHCAEDAAGAGIGEVADLAADAIADISIRESTRYKCSMVLAKAGQSGIAATIAKKISDDSLRREVLLKISRNELNEPKAESVLLSNAGPHGWRPGGPELDTTVDVAAGMAVTFDYIVVGSDGKERSVGNDLCIIAPDRSAFTAHLRNGSTEMMVRSESGAARMCTLSADNGRNSMYSSKGFEGAWEFETIKAEPMKLSEPGRKRIKIAARYASKELHAAALETLYLEIITAPRPQVRDVGHGDSAPLVLEKGVIGVGSPANVLGDWMQKSKP